MHVFAQSCHIHRHGGKLAGHTETDTGRAWLVYLSTPFESILSLILGITIKTGNQAAEGRDKFEFYFMDKGHTL